MTTKEEGHDYRTRIMDSGDPGFVNRLLVATPTTGVIRMEWAAQRYGQVIPVNWSQVQINQFMESYNPLNYQVADAQNLIAKEAVAHDFEWLLLIEHDVCLPYDAFIRLNQYITDAEIPVVSGLYYTRSRPSEPLLFRGRGTGVYKKWKRGDLVWVDGVPTGLLLIHGSILKAMWEESADYTIQYGNTPAQTRRVFDTPRTLWRDPSDGSINATAGTSDLNWCSRVMEEGFFKKAGWAKFQRRKYPFLCDTNLFCEHINLDGERFP